MKKFLIYLWSLSCLLVMIVGCTQKTDKSQSLLKVDDVLELLNEVYSTSFESEALEHSDRMSIMGSYDYLLKADDIQYMLDYDDGRAILKISGSWEEIENKSMTLLNALCVSEDEQKHIALAFDQIRNDENIGMSNIFITKVVVSFCPSINENIVAIYINEI